MVEDDKMKKRRNLTEIERSEMVEYARYLVRQKKSRKEIVDAVAHKFRFTTSSGAATALIHTGVYLPPVDRSGKNSKPDQELTGTQNNIDTSNHPHIDVARTLDAMPNISAKFENGVIHVNNRPYPTHKAYELAGKSWPPC